MKIQKYFLFSLLFIFSIINFASFGNDPIDVKNNELGKILYNTNWDEITKNDADLEKLLRKILDIKDIDKMESRKLILKGIDKNNKEAIFIEINLFSPADPIYIVVFYKDGVLIKCQNIKTESGNIDSDLKDLNNDNIPELIIKRTIVGNASNAADVLWPEVYKWENNKFVLKSIEFKEYYINRKENLKNTLNYLKSNKGLKKDKLLKKLTQYQKADITFHIDKIDRFLGNKNAGFDNAVKWASTSDERLIHNAICVFEDIADDESIKQLEIIRNKKINNNSDYAQRVLDKIKKAFSKPAEPDPNVLQVPGYKAPVHKTPTPAPAVLDPLKYPPVYSYD